MKPLLRILVILTSIGIVVVALLPPDRSTEVEKKTAVSSPAVTPSPTAEPKKNPDSNLIKDLLGGAAIESGRRAKDTLSELNESREKEFGESGL